MKLRLAQVAWALVAGAGLAFGDDAPKTDKPAELTGVKKVATCLHGYRYEFPCKGAMPDKPSPGANCDSDLVKGDPNKTDNFQAERTFGGEAGEKKGSSQNRGGNWYQPTSRTLVV